MEDLSTVAYDDVVAPALPALELTPGPGSPVRDRTPEWLGEDRIEEGQLEAQPLLLGYLKLPEKE